MEVFLDKKNHDGWLATQNVSGDFLQSSLWEKFLNKQGKRTWSINIQNGEQLLGRCLLYENKIGFGRSYLYSPKGPIFLSGLQLSEKIKASHLLFSKIRDITIDTKQYQELFFRFESAHLLAIEGAIKTEDIQPRDTWLTNISLEPKQLLSQSHPKTRYNIGLAQKKGVLVSFSQKTEDLDKFFAVLKKTADRNQIGIHSHDYYQKLWQVLLEEKAGELAIAEIDGQVVAVNLLVKFGQTITYLHGGSDYQWRQYMAPYLLHWQSFKRYQEQGFINYDWWGIMPEDGSKSSWQGVTRFKQGFAGERRCSAGTYDFIYDPAWYKTYQLLRKIWRTFR